MLSFAFSREQEEFRIQLGCSPSPSSRPATSSAPRARSSAGGTSAAGQSRRPRHRSSREARRDRGAYPVTLGLATEALAYGDVNVTSAPVLSGLVASQLAENGQDAVVDEWLPQLIAGNVVAAIAVTEPSCGSDVSRLRTEARRVPGGWRIRGEKIAITLATAASVALVYVREPGSAGYRGISCFAVPLDAEGVTRTHTPGMGALPLCWGQLSFNDVFVPEDHLVGSRAGALRVPWSTSTSAGRRSAFCASARPRRASTKHASGQSSARPSTVRWPPSRVSPFPLRNRRRTWRRPAGSATAHCGRGRTGRTTRTSPRCPSGGRRSWPRTRSRQRSSRSGNLGYSTEMPLQQRYRDVASYLIADGTAGIQKRIIATAMMGKAAAL